MALGHLEGARKPLRRSQGPVLGEGVQGRVPGRLDPVGFEPLSELVARGAVGEQNGEGEVRGALHGEVVERELQTGLLAQSLPVGAYDRASRLQALGEPLDAAQAERGTRLVEPVVEAHVDHVVCGVVAAMAVPGATRQRVGAQQLHARGEVLARAAHHPALAHAELLLGEEAERAELADRPRLAAGAVDLGPDRLRAVLDQDELVGVAELAQRGTSAG